MLIIHEVARGKNSTLQQEEMTRRDTRTYSNPASLARKWKRRRNRSEITRNVSAAKPPVPDFALKTLQMTSSTHPALQLPRHVTTSPIVPVPKLDKPKPSPCGYRFIELLNSLSKILENSFSNVSFSTPISSVSLRALCGTIATWGSWCINRHLKKMCYENDRVGPVESFDSIWQRTFPLKFPIKIVRLVSSCLSQSRFYVSSDCQDHSDQQEQSPAKTPVLFALYVNKISALQHPRAIDSIYVDDITARSPQILNQLLQTQTERIIQREKRGGSPQVQKKRKLQYLHYDTLTDRHSRVTPHHWV